MTDFGERIGQLSAEQRRVLEQRLLRRTTSGRLAPRAPGTPPRLSFGQERVWGLCRLTGDSSTYNISRSHRLRGPLDVDALAAAVDAVVEANGALRTSFASVDGRPQPAPPARPLLVVTDLTGEADPVARIGAWADRPLDPSTGPLFAARLWRLAPDDHVLSLLAHHLVCDGWSMSLIEQQLAAHVDGGRGGASSAALEYADFVEWERSREPLLRAALEGWTSALDGVAPLRLPGERAGGSGEVTVALTAAVSAAVDALARSANGTPFTVLLAIFAATLHGHTGQDDLVVCTPAAGRPDPALEDVVGYFNDLVPIRASVAGDPDLCTLVDRYRDAVLGALDRAVPFQWVAGLPAARSVPLTRALFALNDVPATGLDLPGIDAEVLHLPATGSDFELGWFMRAEGGRYVATIRHRAVTTETVESLAAGFTTVAAAMTASPELPLSGLPALAHPIGSGAEEHADGGPRSGQPRSLLESRLRLVWERVFDRPVGVDEDFFDLGGHSLLAAELIGEIERELSVGRIPLATLFTAPTVARMATLLGADGWESGWASLVPIKPSGDRPPLFFVHGHGGNVVGFSDLGRNLSAAQPLYGLQAPGMDTDAPPRRLEEMAKAYVDEIRTVQPEGPYLVGGWCLGGDVAFEMGQQLRAAGSEVALVLMVDNPRPEHIRTGPTSGPRHVAFRVANRLGMEWANLTEVTPGSRGRYLVERTARLGSPLRSRLERLVTDGEGKMPLGLRHSRAYRQVELGAMHEKAYEEYRPRSYAGRVAVLRAGRQPPGRRADPSLGWSAFVEGPLMLHALPGHRIGLLEGPRAPVVAGRIEEVLHDALEQQAVTPT